MKILPLLPLTLLLAACGKDAPNQSTSGTAKANSSSPTASSTCPSPIALEAAPATWKEIAASEAVTGQPGRWQLLEVVLHEKSVGEGDEQSATTRTTIVDRALGADGVVQTVECKSLGSGGRLAMSAKPQDEISLADGSYSARREVSFALTADGAEKSQRVYAVQEDARFGQSRDKSAQEEEQLKRAGIVSRSKVFRVSEHEIELRAHVEAPDQNGGSTRLFFDMALRYRLKR